MCQRARMWSGRGGGVITPRVIWEAWVFKQPEQSRSETARSRCIALQINFQYIVRRKMSSWGVHGSPCCTARAFATPLPVGLGMIE